MLQRRPVSFRLNDTMISVAETIPASETLLRWLRGPAGLVGTKEGCAEGDCGACTVVLERPDGSREPINACLVALGQLDGASIRTVEGLGGTHPVQHAMAAGNATQCGFCTPGFIMAAWAYAQSGGNVHEALAGNLCRCTGYRPIVDALAGIDAPEPTLPPVTDAGGASFATAEGVVHRPTSLPDLLALRASLPDAWLLAGGTDLGLMLAEARDRPDAMILTASVPELQRLELTEDGLLIGASVSYASLLRLARTIPSLTPLVPLVARLGSRQIRSLGTLGGNLGTASPIGDMLPPLLALGATVRLTSVGGTRTLPVADFLLGYRRNALAPDEIIESVTLELPLPGALFVCEKISKRYDQDISTVSSACLLRIQNGLVQDARLAFGGMGPMAARATAAEQALIGQAWSHDTVQRAAAALAHDFAPLSDLRSTADYRTRAAAALLTRLWWRLAQPEIATDIHDLEIA